jgi:hypothetical protein
MSSAAVSAADRAEIHELLARYAWSLDTADEEGFVACFAPDAELVWDVFETPGTWRGHAALRRFIAWFRARPESAGRQHHVSNAIITPNATGADVRSYVLVALGSEEGPHRLHVMGYYEDTCIRDGDGDGDGWRLARRVIRDWRGAVLANFAGQSGQRQPRPRPPLLDGLWATQD